MAGAYLVGIDGGTEGLRAGIYDFDGNPHAYASTSYGTQFPFPGWAEQNPDDWWQAVGRSVRKAIANSNISPSEIVSLCVDTTCCSVVALDDCGSPLRPAMIWMDVRSDKEANLIAETNNPALIINSSGNGPVSSEWMIPKALWIKNNQPQIYANAATICEYQDYLNYQLTGKIVASANNVAVRWHYLVNKGGFQRSLLSQLGLDDLEAKWPKSVIPLGEIIGGLTSDAAEHLGLPEGLPVAQGGADAFIGMIGLGVVRPGALAFLTGSSHLQLGLSNIPLFGDGIWGTYENALIPGLHVIEGGQTSTGSIINWYKNLLGGDVSYDDLNGEAAKISPGCDGLLVQDHFQGNRTPYTDPLSRGAISGLTLKHTRGHIFRAIIEGIAYGSELILETMRTSGFEVDNVVIAGGATRSDLWLQIHADVSGIPLTLTKVPDAPSLGSAILAAVAIGEFTNITEAADHMVQTDRVVEPNMDNHADYAQIFNSYKRAYPALKSIHS